MRRPERPAPGDAPPSAARERARDDAAAQLLLSSLDDEVEGPPRGLAERIRRRVRDRLTLRDVVDLGTRGFLQGGVLPVAERLGALFRGASAVSPNREPVSPRDEEDDALSRSNPRR